MNKAFLIVLDGWGHGADASVSAIAQAQTPFMDSLYLQYPNSELVTHGEQVGLPDGQMGNSEVGHLNLGAGRVVYQELARINKSIREGDLNDHPVILGALEYARKNKVKFHLIGLVSDGGVHSHVEHLLALCDRFSQEKEVPFYIHAFTDGRDTDPKSGLGFLSKVHKAVKSTSVKIASVVGRYYAMDRDKRWERIKVAYDLLVHGKGTPATQLEQAIQSQYDRNVTDEFLDPVILEEGGCIEPGDVVLFFNFRTDRPRELVEVLSQKDHPDHGMHTMDLYFLTFTRYDDRFQNIRVMYEKEDLTHTLGEVISREGGRQIRIAETEKYPHVTFFFNGGREAVFDGESRILISSPKVATYDLQPEMSAPEVTDAIIEAIQADPPDFICLNFANPDMVGHTGSMPAAIRAVETVDLCLSRIIPLALHHEYNILVLADHGNADFMINPDGTPNTAHTMNPVPLIFVSKNAGQYRVLPGKLGDIAPTILTLMGLPVPEEMTGEVLVKVV